MTYRVILQPQAERDLQRQAQWIVEQSKSPAIALRWVRSIRAKIETLKTSPPRCPVDPDSDAYGEEVRILLFGQRYKKFRILFALRGDVVQVFTIRNSAQRSLSEEAEAESDEPEPSR